MLQGLTLRPLILLLKLRDDDPVNREVQMACERVVQAGLQVLDEDQSKEAEVIRSELESQLTELRDESKDINELDEYSAVRVESSLRNARRGWRCGRSTRSAMTMFRRDRGGADVVEVNALGAEYP